MELEDLPVGFRLEGLGVPFPSISPYVLHLNVTLFSCKQTSPLIIPENHFRTYRRCCCTQMLMRIVTVNP